MMGHVTASIPAHPPHVSVVRLQVQRGGQEVDGRPEEHAVCCRGHHPGGPPEHPAYDQDMTSSSPPGPPTSSNSITHLGWSLFQIVNRIPQDMNLIIRQLGKMF